MSKLSPSERNRLKSRVLAVCLAAIAEGFSPSEYQLRERIAGHGPRVLVVLRDELVAEGRLAWRPAASRRARPRSQDGAGKHGLRGEVAEELAEIERIKAEIRLQKGEPPPGRVPAFDEHVYRHPAISVRQRGG